MTETTHDLYPAHRINTRIRGHMTLQSVPPPPCLCQHGAEWHSRNYHICTRCLCNKYRPDKHQYPTGILVSS